MSEQQDVKPNITSLMASKPVLASQSRRLQTMGPQMPRLPSFKAPRDLTLSANINAMFKPPALRQKKKVAPNIPTKKEKSIKLEPSLSEKTSKRSPNKSKSFGRGKNRREKEYFQTKGSLFGDGVNIESRKLKTRASSSYHQGEASVMSKPVFDGKSDYNYDKELEGRKMKELYKDDFIDDPDGHNSPDNGPVTLPFPIAYGQKIDAYVKVEPNLEIKKEPTESMDGVHQLADQINNVEIDSNVKGPVSHSGEQSTAGQEELSISDILSVKNDDLIFLQLPPCLPSHPPESTVPKRPYTSSIFEMNESAKMEGPKCTMKSLSEGRLGTLKIYKSGKTELWLGDHKLLIKKGVGVRFLEDAVSISTDSKTKTGSMSVLGHIKHRLLAIPDFDVLLSESGTGTCS